MDITPALSADKLLVRSYGSGGFDINGQRFEGSLFLLLNTVRHWTCDASKGINYESLNLITEASDEIDILLIGAGEHTVLLDKTLRSDLAILGLQTDVMTTGAACRTYNVLAHEDRRVAAALISID